MAHCGKLHLLQVLPRKPKCQQFLTIHAIVDNEVSFGTDRKLILIILASLRAFICLFCPLCQSFPVVYAMMSNKTAATYKMLLQYVKSELAPGWDPEEFMTDFEKGLRKAIREVFPNATLNGCYFHYTQVLRHFYVNTICA